MDKCCIDVNLSLICFWLTDSAFRKIHNSHRPIIWVLGGPGSGRSTQCSKLADEYKFAHLSAHNLIQTEVQANTDLGKSIQKTLDQGQFVRRKTVIILLKKAMAKASKWAKGYLIDDYPRNLVQAEDLAKRVGRCSLILYMKCSDEEMKRRVLLRATENNLNVDVVEDAFTERLDLFQEVTELITIEYESKVVTIECDNEIGSIMEQCKVAVDRLLKNWPKHCC